jgi:Rps23 Pro-64 3,4-dihydroxylase Tpa1-like proline 4-hydroxylase
MPLVNAEIKNGWWSFDKDKLLEAGNQHSTDYQNASPFPHIKFDNFLDTSLLEQINESFPSRDDRTPFLRAQERLKYQFTADECESILIKNVLSELNGVAFLRFLSALTGIRNLMPDPYFLGAGLHETLKGGHLSVHADFNVHPNLNAQRRINLLIYLNADWDPSFGGNLELWDKAMTHCVHSVAPTLGTAVIFNTDLDAFHGQPDALTCPDGRSRRSIALYYYTYPEEGVVALRKRATNFKTRPNTGDKPDLELKVKAFAADWIPRRMHKNVYKVIEKLFGQN